MPCLLERVPIRAFNENHDELGRFSSGDGAGSRAEAIKELASSPNAASQRAAKLTQKADKQNTAESHLKAAQAHMAAIGSALRLGDRKAVDLHVRFMTEHGEAKAKDKFPFKVDPKTGSAKEVKSSLGSFLPCVRILPGVGRELPRIVAFNENHDELGRFASDEGGGASGGNNDRAAHVNQIANSVSVIHQSAGRNPQAMEMADSLRPDLEKLTHAELKTVSERMGSTPADTKKGTVDKIVRDIKDRAAFADRFRSVEEGVKEASQPAKPAEKTSAPPVPPTPTIKAPTLAEPAKTQEAAPAPTLSNAGKQSVERLQSLREAAKTDPNFRLESVKSDVSQELDQYSKAAVKDIARAFGIINVPSSKSEAIQKIAQTINDAWTFADRMRISKGGN